MLAVLAGLTVQGKVASAVVEQVVALEAPTVGLAATEATAELTVQEGGAMRTQKLFGGAVLTGKRPQYF